jgi:translocation and assembly module TamB
MAADPKRDLRNPRRENPGNAKAPPKRKRRWKLLLMLAVLAMLVWFLPIIATNTPLMPWGVKMAGSQLNGSIAVESASLGWLSPVVVRGVEVKDAQGKSVLTLAELTSERTLAGLLWNYTRLGLFRLKNPKVSLVMRDDGSNLEDVLAKLLAPPPKPEPEKKEPFDIGFAVEIIDAGVSIVDLPTGRQWQMQKLSGGFDMSSGPVGPMVVKLSAEAPDDRLPGKLFVNVKTAGIGGGEVALSAEGLSLAILRPIAARLKPGATLVGQLSSNVNASWGALGGKNSVQADLKLKGLSFTAADLQTDVVQLDQCVADCQISWEKDRIEVERASVACDVGNLALLSTMKLDGKSGWSMDSLLRQRHEISGNMDLARLARLMPATLRLKRQVEIRSGQVWLALSSKAEQQGMVWHGQLDTANLTATATGRQIAWQRPLAIVLDAHDTADGPVVDVLRCESDFLKIFAKGTPNDLTASTTFNLKQLSDQLGQFVDLGGMQLNGEGDGNFNWKRSPQRQFETDADVRLHNFQLALKNQPAWREDNLNIQFAAKGQTDLGVDTRIDSGTLNVNTPTDQIELRLAQAVKDLRNGGAWPVQAKMKGQLQNWPGRLAAWLPMTDCRFSGSYDIQADGTASADAVELRQARINSMPLVISSPWVNVNEPQLDLTMAGSWNRQHRRIAVDPVNLNCATLAVQASRVLFAMPEKGPVEMSGTLKYQGDAARIRRALSDSAKPSPWQLAGKLTGEAAVQQSGGAIRGETSAEIVNLAVIDAAGQQFQEPRIRLAARGGYDNSAKAVLLDQLDITSDSNILNAKVAGRVAPAAGVNNADIKGKVDYDLERLSGLLRPYIGPGVQIMGRNSTAVSYLGPFALATGQASAGMRWDGANIYGMRLGPGELKGSMANGAVKIDPMELAVSQGRLRLAPQLRIASDPMELVMPKGPLAQQIQIDPAMCSSSLKYIAPVMADVASARGSFSIELDDTDGRAPCRIPLSNPKMGELTGRLIIHSVEIGPGPLIRTLAVLMGRETPARLRKESVVPFQMVGGRMYHQNMELLFPDFTVRTKGYVGLVDQKIGILAEMPVPPKWTQNNPVLSQAVRNEIIQLPIAGTLTKPELDPRKMQELNQRFLRKAAGNILEGEVNKQLDRLLGPPKK